MTLANVITLARLPLLIVVLGILFFSSTWGGQITGLGLLGALFLMDWLDGVAARQRRQTTDLGAVLDIALDRTVENVLWIAFMHLGLVAFWVPVFFLVRSFLVDGIRGIALVRGKPGFSMMHTPWGRFLVASRFMRGLYGLAKVADLCLPVARPCPGPGRPPHPDYPETSIRQPGLADGGTLPGPGHPGALRRPPLFPAPPGPDRHGSVDCRP